MPSRNAGPFADLLYRVRAIVRRSTMERELDDELRFHVERAAERFVASGLTRDEALRRARREFGGLDQIKEECRDARGTEVLETLLQDARYGLRAMRRAPLVAATTVATLALSTGALATVFTLGYTLFFRPLPVDRPDELVTVSATRGGVRTDGLVSYPDYVAFRDHATTLSALAADYPTAPLFVSAKGTAREINGAVVSANFFPVLGLRPALGRFFRDDEDRVPDRDRVAVISDTLWRNTFAAASDAVGSSLTINGVDFTVVGVAPQTFVTIGTNPIDIYIPTMMLRVGYRWCDDALSAGCTMLEMIGRLAPGRTLPEAAAEMSALMPASWAHAPRGENSGVAVARPQGFSTDDEEPRLVRILAAVAVVLILVACANLAGLLTARGAARAQEFRIRSALGAGSGRIVRQIVTESVMVAAAGGCAGVLMSRGLIAALAAAFYAMDDEGHRLYYDFGLTPAIVVTTIAAAIIAGCLFSVVPAMRVVARRKVGAPAARSSAARWSSGRWLLAGQAAAAVALVAVAALLAASARLMASGRNYDATHVALMRVRPRLVKYSPERAQRFQREVVRRLDALPSVESVTMVGVGSILGGGAADVAPPEWTDGQRLRAGFNEIGPRYFATLRTPLVAGREFDDRDSMHAPPVAVVNETLARSLWPGRSALGAAVLVNGAPHAVVGVVRDVALKSRVEADDPWIFVPFWQNPAAVDSRLAIRVAGDPAAVLPALMREVSRVDPDVPIAETITLSMRVAGLTRPLRVSAAFVGYAAILAVVLTTIGMYGALAFAVSTRTKEIGIRLALGARRAQVLGRIVDDGMSVVAAGALAGLGLAAAGSRLVAHLLYGSPAMDWIFYAVAVLVVVIAGFLASLLPARRAASVEPLVALRHE